MGVAHQEEHDPSKEVRLVIPPKGLVSYPRLRGILTGMVRQMGFKLSIDGADLSTAGPGQMHFKVPGGGAAGDRPWMVKKLESGNFGITGGSYNEIEIENLELPDDETLWIFIEATWTLDVTSGYVQSAELETATLETGASVPPNAPATAKFYVPIAKVVNGRLETQSAMRAVTATVCDSGANNGTAQHNVLQS